MSQAIVYGPAFSTYVRSVRLALEEKGVPYEMSDVDFLGGAHKKRPHIERQPFGKVPAFSHAGHELYETSAILTYIEGTFSGPKLVPAEPIDQARMMQVMSVVDSYGYKPCVLDLFLQRVFMPMQGAPADETIIEAGKEPATRFAIALSKLLGNKDYFVGTRATLADLHALPVVTYLAVTPEGQEILERTPNLRTWLSRMGQRSSVQNVMPN